MDNQQATPDDIRRKLLKAAVYAPPVILGSMVATPRSAIGAINPIGTTVTCQTKGGATTVIITVSSGTNACCPCVPGSTGRDAYNPTVCAEARCVVSCGTNCSPGQIATISCKQFCTVCGTHPVGCVGDPCTCGGKGKTGCK